MQTDWFAAREGKVLTTARRFGIENTDAYWENRVAKGASGQKRIHQFMANLVDRLASSGSTVLDCAAGCFHLIRLCSRKHRTFAVELSSTAIAMSNSPLTEIRQADLNEGIPDFGERFDVIMASMILHWLDVPESFLRAAKAFLKPAGRLIVNIPNITHIKYRWWFLRGHFPAVSLSHKNFQSPREFEAMARACGFAIEGCLTPRPAWHARLWPRLFSHDLVYVLRPEAPAAGRTRGSSP